MRAPLIVAISLFAHIGATVVLGLWLPKQPHDYVWDVAANDQTPPHVVTTEPAASYYEVTLLPPDPAPQQPATTQYQDVRQPRGPRVSPNSPMVSAASRVGADAVASTNNIITTTTTTTLPRSTDTPAQAPASRPAGASALSMRAGPGKAMGRKPQLVLGSDAPVTEQLAAVTANIPKSGLLAPTIGGGAVADQGVFTAYVRRDGSFKIVNKPNFSIGLALPSPRALGQGLVTWYNNPYAAVREQDSEREQAQHQHSSSDDPKPDRGGTVPIIKGGFDLTAALMRGDAYLANKRRFLDATRPERVQIAARYREQQLHDAGTMMRQRLAELTNQLVTPSMAKMTLFEMWDECADGGEALVVKAGRDARLAVLGYIAVHFSAGSTTAFSDEEITMFNARRRSTTVFVPYP